MDCRDKINRLNWTQKIKKLKLQKHKKKLSIFIYSSIRGDGDI